MASRAGTHRRIGNTGTSSNGRSAPRLFNLLTELPRTLFEVTSMTASWLPLITSAPKGVSHPILVMPGLMASDRSTALLRRFLSELGYEPFPWLQGTNTGSLQQLENAMRRFYQLHQATDRPITVIGQSLGGVFAREIAQTFPSAVRSVITLGSPYKAFRSGSTSPVVEKLFQQTSGLTIEEMRASMPDAKNSEALLVPTTSIYSTADGIVGWRTCVEPETALSENVRVRGSHCGMAMNPDVLGIIADRLAQDPAAWRPFDTKLGCRRLVYPRPA